MSRFFIAVAAVALQFFCLAAQATDAWPLPRPKLVVVVVIDQFRADYLIRSRSQFSVGGFRALIEGGAYFPFAEYDIMQSMTGPGHATILTGSYPYLAGIPINDWYDQDLHDSMYCTEDRSFETVGAPSRPHVGTSPKNLIGTTLGDEIKNAGLTSKQISIALKDRASILLGGHRADLAIWQDNATKKWVSSRYYIKKGDLPSWVQALNADPKLASCDTSTPCGLELTEAAVESAIKSENLGSGTGTDLLTISFSSHDYTGHKFGPNSPEIDQMTLSEDHMIQHLRSTLAHQMKTGLKDVVFVLTGDHGVAPAASYLQNTGIESGRIDEDGLRLDIEAQLNLKCATKTSGNWIGFFEDFNFYVNEAKLQGSKCDLAQVEAEMKSVLLKNKAFVAVFTRGEVLRHDLPPGLLGRQIAKTFYLGRTGNVVALPKPFYVNLSRNFATHMTGYSYDRMVPLIISGPGFKHGVFAGRTEVIDIAPTLAFALGVIPPALSEGRVLSEALQLK